MVKDGYNFREKLRYEFKFKCTPKGAPPAVAQKSWTYLAKTFEEAESLAKRVRLEAKKAQGRNCNKVGAHNTDGERPTDVKTNRCIE